jgi:serine/threonine protein kinase
VDDPNAVEEDHFTEPLTRQGLVIGTLPYMSPEQVQGEPVDLRTDIFSLGAVLYEMASGKRPSTGKSSNRLWWLGAFAILGLAFLFYLIRHAEDLLSGGLGPRFAYLVVGLVFAALVLLVPYRYGRDHFDVQHPPLVERARLAGSAELESFERSGEMTVVVDEGDRVLATIQLSEQGKLVSFSQVDAFEPRPQSKSLRALVTTIEESERHDAKAIAGKWLD